MVEQQFVPHSILRTDFTQFSSFKAWTLKYYNFPCVADWIVRNAISISSKGSVSIKTYFNNKWSWIWKSYRKSLSDSISVYGSHYTIKKGTGSLFQGLQGGYEGLIHREICSRQLKTKRTCSRLQWVLIFHLIPSIYAFGCIFSI